VGSDANYTKQIFRWQQQVLADAELTPLASRVVMALCGFINSQSHDAWPSHATLAKAVHASRRGVQNALQQLEDRGHLQISINRGRGQSNRYRPLLAPKIEAERHAPDNANRSAHFRDQVEQEKYELGCAGVRTPVRTGVRSRVRTNYLKRELSEELSAADVEASVDKERAFEDWWPHYRGALQNPRRERPIVGCSTRS
jgi:hypothetical protein